NSLHAGWPAARDLLHQKCNLDQTEKGGDLPAGRGLDMELTPGSEAKTSPEEPICGAKWNSAGHCRESNRSQKLAPSASVPVSPETALSALTPPRPASTVDSNATSSALESTGSMIPAHITR